MYAGCHWGLYWGVLGCHWGCIRGVCVTNGTESSQNSGTPSAVEKNVFCLQTLNQPHTIVKCTQARYRCVLGVYLGCLGCIKGVHSGAQVCIGGVVGSIRGALGVFGVYAGCIRGALGL